VESLLAIVIGALYGFGLYSLMRRSIVKVIIGLALLGHAANLLIFTAGGLSRGAVPLIDAGATALVPPHADPLPQALVLTAIVIGFAVQAFALVLLRRAHQTIGADDLNAMRSAEG
jgi:multicomponent Na+:H+ antiporter subunit C